MKFQQVTNPLINTPTILPTRATQDSAGYDIRLKTDIQLNPGEVKLTFSDVKCELEPNEVLYLHIRSSVGYKKGVALANGTGVIDSDYYGNPDNDGNIGLPLYNYSDKVVTFKAGERVAQGVIHEFKREDITYDGLWNAVSRVGGFGSSDLAEEIRDRINEDEW